MKQDPTIHSVLSGSLEKLPVANSKVVRIFISSTFTDTQEERNILIEDIHPKIAKKCKEKYGLEYQVVDMRWGVPEDAVDDHSAADLCFREIINCQKLSTGPNFVAFLNQKHGFHHLQPRIPQKEFQVITFELTSRQEDISLLKQWYLEDTNACPPEFVLQPISNHIPEYKEKTQNAFEEWNIVYRNLQRLLRQGSKACVDKGVLTSVEEHKYRMSVTEEEIIHGVFNLKLETSDTCMCFVRIIEDISKHLHHPIAWRFIDMIDRKKLDTESQEILENLRDKKLQDKLRNKSMVRTIVSWSENNGINRNEHKEYLQGFANSFYHGVMSRIKRAVEKENKLSEDPIYLEVLHHSTMANQRNAMFHGREEEMLNIQEYLNSEVDEPFVIYGPSGSGKTSIMAQAAKQVPYVYNKNAVVILRLLGTSPDSSNLHLLLSSICKQVLFNLQDPTNVPDEFNELLGLFHTLLEQIEFQSKLKFVFVLDSLDQLTNEHNAHKLKWLPKKVGKNIRMIVSVYTDSNIIIENLKLMFNSKRFLYVKILGEDLSVKIIKSWLQKNNRTLTSEQFLLVQKAFKECSLPLYVKLVFEEILTWKSYSKINNRQLAFSVQECINSLLQRLENKHGKMFVTHTLSYITASLSGLSEKELEDILSLDDVLLTEVFRIHVPPVRRIPPLLWVRLKNDIESYLSVKDIDETRVFFWYHRQFIESTTKCYLQNHDFKKKIYSNLADFYLGKWYNKPKPFIYSEVQMKKLGLTSAASEEDRKVSNQPLMFVYEEDGKKCIRYNYRKLNKLPECLWHADRIEELRNVCLFNFEWLKTKSTALSISQVLHDFTSCGLSQDSYLYKVLSTAQSTLKKYPNSLTMEISGHFLPLFSKSSNKHEKQIVEQCLQEEQSEPYLLPYQNCFHSPNESIRYKLEHPNFPLGLKQLAVSGDSKHIYALDSLNILLSWDIDMGELEFQTELFDPDVCKLNIMNQLVQEDALTFGTSHQKQKNPVIIVNMKTGDVKENILLSKNYPGVGFTDSLQFVFFKNTIVAVHVGHATDVFERHSGKLLQELGIIADNVAVLPEKQCILLHLKDSTKYKLLSSQKFQCLVEFESKSVPLGMIVEPSENEFFVFFKDSSQVEVFDLDASHQSISKAIATFDAKLFLKDDVILEMSLSQNKEYLIIKCLKGFLLRHLKTNKLKHTFTFPPYIESEYKVITHQGLLTLDGKFFIASYNYSMVIWDTAKNKIINIIETGKSTVQKMIFSADGKFLLTTSVRNNFITVWIVSSLSLQSRKVEPLIMPTAPRYVHVAETGKTAVMRGNRPNEIALLDIHSAKIKGFFPHNQETMTPSMTPDGKLITFREYESEHGLKLYSSESLRLVGAVPLSTLMVRFFHMTDSKMAVLCDKDGRSLLSVWSLPDCKNILDKDMGVTYPAGIFLYSDHEMSKVFLPVPCSVERAGADVTHVDFCMVNVETGESQILFYNVLSERVIPYQLASCTFLFEQAEQKKSKFIVYDYQKQKIVRQSKQIRSTSSILHINAKNAIFGIDKQRYLYDLETFTVVCCFDENTVYPKDPTRHNSPVLSYDGSCAVWVNTLAGLILVGNTRTKMVVNICPTHGIPLTLNITCNDIILVGCEDGRLMMLSLVMPNQKESSENIISRFLSRQKDNIKKQYEKITSHNKKTTSSFCTIV